MRSRQIEAILFSFCLLGVETLYADKSDEQKKIYQCQDSRGNAVYQDGPCDTGVQREITEDDLLRKQNRITDSSDSTSIDNLVNNGAFDTLQHWSLEGLREPPFSQSVTANGQLAIFTDNMTPNKRYIYEVKVTQCIELTEAKFYQFGGRFKSQGLARKQFANDIEIIWYESIDCSSGGQFGAYLRPKLEYGWQSLIKTKVRKSIGAKAVKIQITKNRAYANNDVAIWDDVFFIPETNEQLQVQKLAQFDYVKRQGNYLANGGFDRDLAHWRKGWESHWQSGEGVDYSGAIQVIAQSDRGSVGTTAFSQCVDLGSWRKYTASIQFRRDINSMLPCGARFRVTWFDDKNCKGSYKTDRHADPSSGFHWQALNLKSLEAPNTALSVRVTAIQSVPDSGRAICYWDNAEFYARLQ